MGIAHVRLFGKLHTIASGRGQPIEFEVEVANDGVAAEIILDGLGLPLELAEGVFINHKVHPMGHLVKPGDSIAFVSRGVPGPHRFTLGLYNAGKSGHENGDGESQ